MPSWVGDAVMATPALRLLRDNLPGAFIGGLVRPGIDEVLAGTTFFDELHIERASGVMGPKHAAAKVRPRRYDTALLLTNSFSTALITRIAGIPRRIGYSRDARGVLLTDKLEAPRQNGRWAPIPAVTYYHHAASYLLDALRSEGSRGADAPPAQLHPSTPLPPNIKLELATTQPERDEASRILREAGIPEDARLAILNPGGNNPAKRWPPDRFAAVGRHLIDKHNMNILVSGSPGERELCDQIAEAIGADAISLASRGVRLASLKAVIQRSRLMITNDTGPRHIAAALGIPVISVFGPTDPRWTTIPAPAGEAILTADPTLPESEVADDHPERCRIERIETRDVIAAADRLLGRR
jgi:heptosyltransferase II